MNPSWNLVKYKWWFFKICNFRLAVLVGNGVQMTSVKMKTFQYNLPIHLRKTYKRATIANCWNLLQEFVFCVCYVCYKHFYGRHNRTGASTILDVVTKFFGKLTLLDIKSLSCIRTVRTEENIASSTVSMFCMFWCNFVQILIVDGIEN